MKNSLAIFAISSILLAGQAFAQGSTVTTHKTIVTTTTSIPHDANAVPMTSTVTKTSPQKATQKMTTKTCPAGTNCDTPAPKKKAKKNNQNNNM